MQMQGERKIVAKREKVWAALNEPTVLKASIPGCEALDGTVSEGITATAAFKVGPISARFSGKVTFSEVDPPNGYVMAGEGAGGIAGFAKGGARVSLEDVQDGTLLRYNVDAQVGGKIAQLGARLIDATAKKMADQFFVRFASEVEQTNSDLGKPMDEAVQAASTELPASGVPDFGPSSIQAAPAAVAAGPRDYPNALALSAMVAVVGIVAIVAMLIYALAR
jgi:carbon monoxide dehydrogenase subunit G